MLKMYVIDKLARWEDYLHLVEFTYNNGYQETIGMSPFEAQYSKKCRTLTTWDGAVKRVIVGQDMLKEMEQKMVKIRQNMKVAQDRQKNHVDLKRTHKEFKSRYHVYQ